MWRVQIFQDENGERQCAQLPQRWDWKGAKCNPTPRGTSNWKMGAPATYDMLGVEWGTVMATFDRVSGKYRNASSGNHTIVFHSWVKETSGILWWKKETFGMRVYEQGPGFPPTSRVIWFDSSKGYFKNAGAYNVVLICE